MIPSTFRQFHQNIIRHAQMLKKHGLEDPAERRVVKVRAPKGQRGKYEIREPATYSIEDAPGT